MSEQMKNRGNNIGKNEAADKGNRAGHATRVRRLLIVGFWLAVWTAAALIVDHELLMATPLDTLKKLAELSCTASFYRTVLQSVLRISLGFFVGFAGGILLAFLAGRFSLLEDVLSPVMKLMSTVPVASFVVLLLIWWGSQYLAVAICIIVVLPIVYMSTLEGIKSMDRTLLEMTHVLRISPESVFFYVWRPALRPFLTGSLKIASGMCWKSGVAAEVIGMTDYSIGGQLYLSKVFMDTVGVFAWTVTVICLSVIFERLLLALTNVFFAWQPACRAASKTARSGADGKKQDEESLSGKRQEAVVLENVLKTYDGRVVLDHLSATYRKGETYYLTGPSGSGKTTLLRLIAGLEQCDAGEVQCFGEISFLFQEDRLCPDYSAVKNLELVTGDADRARNALSEVLEAEDLDKPCSALSGGMKRRVALVRALEKESDIVLLDEPFTGMDEQTKERVMNYLERKKEGRTFLIATHN